LLEFTIHVGMAPHRDTCHLRKPRSMQAFIAENSTKAFDLQLSLPLRGAA